MQDTDICRCFSKGYKFLKKITLLLECMQCYTLLSQLNILKYKQN